MLKHLKSQFGADEAATKAWYAHWITEGFGGLEDYVAQTRLSGRFCFGDSVTMADICLVPQIFNAARFDCPLDDYPMLKAIFDRCMELDAFRARSRTRRRTPSKRSMIFPKTGIDFGCLASSRTRLNSA